MYFLILACLLAQPLDSDLVRAAHEQNLHWPGTVIPWVELNYPHRRHDPLLRETDLDRAIVGLRAWSRVTDTAVVSTLPGKSWLYLTLRERVPNMTIIPGIKTAPLLPQFDNLAGWAAIAEEVENVRRTSGQNTVLLEHETALRPIVLGEYAPDVDTLRMGLALLPSRVEYVWRPSLFWFISGDGGRDRLADVCRIAEEVLPDVIFVDQSHNAKHNVGTRRFVEAQAILESIASKPTIPKAYFYGSLGPYIWWRDEDFHELLRLVRDRQHLIVYPGLHRLHETARTLGEQLNPRKEPF